MGQKVNPISLRLGVNRTWDSRWYADEKFTTEFDFTKPFEGNVSIYTKLTKIVNESQTKEEEKNPKTSDMNLALILTSLGLASVGAVLVSRKKLAKANR